MSESKSTAVIPMDFSTPEHWEASMRYAEEHAGEEAPTGSKLPISLFEFAAALTREHFAEMRRAASGEHDRAALELFRDDVI